MFTSEKVFDGFSACFRQWRAEGTHCKFVHGYGISFKIWFAGELNERNWVFDFGGMKRAKEKINGMSPVEFFNYMFDHTVLVAKDDPQLSYFEHLDEEGIIQLRILENVGAEQFAKFIYTIVQNFVDRETNGRVYVVKVKFMEHRKNSATYKPKN
jgi:6-pyruvoyltetrahydropterin/6-carboxytetrahydropterin synthase